MYLTFSILSVSCKLLTRKWAGNPWIPSAGIATAFLQLGQTITVGLLVLSLFLALAHLSKHSSQNEWRQGSPRGFLKGSRQIPQCIKFWVIFSAKILAILPSYDIGLLPVYISCMGWASFLWTLNIDLLYRGKNHACSSWLYDNLEPLSWLIFFFFFFFCMVLELVGGSETEFDKVQLSTKFGRKFSVVVSFYFWGWHLEA